MLNLWLLRINVNYEDIGKGGDDASSPIRMADILLQKKIKPPTDDSVIKVILFVPILH